jgi:hypothetical protein
MKKYRKNTSKIAPAKQRRNVNPDTPELIFNLWYVLDESGLIASLLAKEHIVAGTDLYKSKMLKERGNVDYVGTRIFEVPRKYDISGITPDGVRTIIPCTHKSMLKKTRKGRDLFDEAIETIKKEYAGNRDVLIHDDPLYCVTPLRLDSENNTLSSPSMMARFATEFNA